MRSMPGTWVVFLLMFPLTALNIIGIFATAGGFPGHTFFYVHGTGQERVLLGGGYRAAGLLAPVMGVLCITTEYRHKTITTTLVLTPKRERVLLGKILTVSLWAVFMTLLGFVAVLTIGLPWQSALGGSSSAVFDQFGAVIPGLVAALILLALFGLGFGTLVKNQVAGILVTIGGSFILEPLLIVLAHQIFHYDLNWLPSGATAALAGASSQGGFNSANDVFNLLTWWQGGLAMLGWGLVPLTIGYFTTFRRDVT
jgi:ABC-2 type transport system permease protein